MTDDRRGRAISTGIHFRRRLGRQRANHRAPQLLAASRAATCRGTSGRASGLVWIGVLIFAAILAPLLANTQPILLKADNHWSSPLLTHLTPADVTLLALAVIVVLRSFGRPEWSALAASDAVGQSADGGNVARLTFMRAPAGHSGLAALSRFAPSRAGAGFVDDAAAVFAE